MIYLDNSATTQPLGSVVDAMSAAMREEYFNPSSLYAAAMLSANKMKETRERLARSVGGAKRVIFTSGGTEADNLALLGTAAALRGRKGAFITTAIEHPAVLECMKQLEKQGHATTILPVTSEGVVDLDALEAALSEQTTLVSVMHVNNEVGAIQPIAKIAVLLRQKAPQAVFHVDGVQGYLKAPIHLKENGVDLYTVSGHKIHGPKGIGALLVRDKLPFLPILFGGGQESGDRSGTENTPGIVGLGEAIRAYGDTSQQAQRLMEMKLTLLQGIREAVPEALLNGGDPEQAAPHILNLSFPVRGEVLLHALEGEGVLVSTGSACSSHKKTASHVLTAMGLSPERMDGAIRFSLSPLNTMDEMHQAAQAVGKCVDQLKRFKRR